MGGEFESTYYNGGRSAHPTIASISGGMGGEFESTYYNGGRSAHPTTASISGGMGGEFESTYYSFNFLWGGRSARHR
jgi:hypothetical protein